MTTRTRLAICTFALIATALSVVLAGCGASHTDAPDPTAANTHPGTNEAVMQYPDGFRNVAFECHGTTGVYVTSHGQTTDAITSGIAVLANDPACAG
jgi:hypothetical protein